MQKEKNYPQFMKEVQQLMGAVGQEIPETMAAFGQLHKAAVKRGALNPATKELIILGIAICMRCEGCVTFHVHDALRAGATRQEIAETIGVALLMGGGPALAYGSYAMQALAQFEEQAGTDK